MKRSARARKIPYSLVLHIHVYTCIVVLSNKSPVSSKSLQCINLAVSTTCTCLHILRHMCLPFCAVHHKSSLTYVPLTLHNIPTDFQQQDELKWTLHAHSYIAVLLREIFKQWELGRVVNNKPTLLCIATCVHVNLMDDHSELLWYPCLCGMYNVHVYMCRYKTHSGNDMYQNGWPTNLPL